MLGFGYNPASQIISETRDNDAYVHRGDYNVTRAYVANGLNQYVSAGPASFTYDPNGNLTSDGAVTYAYDVENRIIGASGAKTANLKYDPLGRLYEVNAGSPASATRFLYDGDALVGEYDGTSNAISRRYIHGSGVDEPLIWYEGADLTNRRSLRANHQGSIIAVAGSAGQSIGALTYDPYGIPGSANFGRFQYTGQIWLAELGVYHYKARAYSPTLGRFLQTDPIGYEDQVNLYAYVGNDPVNKFDPSGEESGSITCMFNACSPPPPPPPPNPDDIIVVGKRERKEHRENRDGVRLSKPLGERIVEAPNDQPSMGRFIFDSIIDGLKMANAKAQDKVADCVDGASDISVRQTAQDAAKGAARGAATSGARSAILSGAAPEVAATRAALGGLSSGATSAATSAAKQACDR